MSHSRVFLAGSLLAGLLLAAGCTPTSESTGSGPTPPTGAPSAPGGGPGGPGGGPGAASGGAAAATGPEVFAQFCQGCHGDKGQGGTAKVNLAEEAGHESEAELREVVLNGKGKMPSFKGRLSDAQLDAVIAHVKGLGGEGGGH